MSKVSMTISQKINLRSLWWRLLKEKEFQVEDQRKAERKYLNSLPNLQKYHRGPTADKF